MTYATSNPPRLVTQAIAGKRGWEYVSTDTAATVDTSGYITNAKALGLLVGDNVKVFNTTSNIITSHTVVAINADGSADLSNGTSIADASSNSD